MRKLIIILISLFLITPVFAETVQINDIIDPGLQKRKIDFYDQKTREYLGSMTYWEFYNVSKSAKLHDMESEAEDSKRIKVFLKDKVWKVKKGEGFKTELTIVWYDADNNEIKRLVLEADVKLLKDQMKKNKFREFYTKTAEVGFPIVTVLLIILLAL